MDLNDAERYAVAALFTLALHSTHVETGVDKNGNSLSESDIAWGCPSEELFDEYLMSQEPLKLPAALQDIFWGHDCMAHAGLAPRLYAWLRIPRKAWPGLLRMPDLAGSGAGSAAAVEAFVALVRRYSAFLDPELAFTTGQANRLQQRFSVLAGNTAADDEQQQHGAISSSATGADDGSSAGASAGPATLAEAGCQTAPGGSSAPAASAGAAGSSDDGRGAVLGVDFVQGVKSRSTDEGSSKSGAEASGQPASSSLGVPAAEAVAAAAASVTAAAIAAAAEASPDGAAAATKAPSTAADSASGQQPHQEVPDTAANSAAKLARASSAAAELDELRQAVDHLPRAAAEGTVVPAATFTPAEHYEHSTSHKAVLAVYELIGGCLSSNSEQLIEALVDGTAAREAESAAAAALAQKERQQRQQSGGGASDSAAAAAAVPDSGSSSLTKRPSAAWFPADAAADADDVDQTSSMPSARSGSSSAAAAAAPDTAAAAASKSQPQQELSQQQQATQQGLAVLQWYDARARVAVKRVAHWLRVPWPQVRAFEQMWAAQALSVDPSTQPKYTSGSRALTYLKVGAAAVGGGALLAVTGGLAAPAIAAGLGAAVTLVHGGAATAAAVAAAAGSTAGTAAVTGLFGAWGASVGGGSAGRLYGEVKEFGFWDLGASIYTDGTALADRDAAAAAAAAAEEEAAAAGAAAAEKQEQGTSAAAAALGKAAAGEAAAAYSPPPAAAAGQEPGLQQQQQQAEQQSSFLYRLFSSNQDSSSTTSSSSSSSNKKQAAASAAAAAAVAANASAAGAERSSRSNPSSPSQQQQQQPSRLWGWGRQPVKQDDVAAVDEEVEEAALQTRYIRLQEDAFSDDDCEEDVQQQRGTPSGAPAASGSDKKAAEASAAAGTAAAASSPVAVAGAAAPSDKGVNSLFRSKAAAAPQQAPVHVPLLPTPINPKHQAEMRIALTIAVNGCCISSIEDFVRPWLNLPSRDCDRFALVWESACLKELGGALVSFIAQQALTQVTQRTIQAFLYTGLVGALALPMTLTTAMKVAFGSKWLVALRRAQAAGKMLAMQLAQGCHGGRPVTLIGCSMGARLIFHTLLELSRLGAHGCVENVILLGAPLSCRPDRWCIARSVVSGRLINGYSLNDWTLGLLYRVHSSSSIWLQAAGIWKVDVPGVENVNLSRLVNGHSDYLTAMDEILEVINMHDV